MNMSMTRPHMRRNRNRIIVSSSVLFIYNILYIYVKILVKRKCLVIGVPFLISRLKFTRMNSITDAYIWCRKEIKTVRPKTYITLTFVYLVSALLALKSVRNFQEFHRNIKEF